MIQHQAQRKFGLVQQHFSQQDTLPIQSITTLSALVDSSMGYTSLMASNQAQYREDPITSGIAQQHCMPFIYNLSDEKKMPVMQAKPLENSVNGTQDLTIKEEVNSARKDKTRTLRIIAVVVVLVLAPAFYFIWRPTHTASSLSPSPVITQQRFRGSSPTVSAKTSSIIAATTTTSGSDIQVYILGAVQHPGVYVISANARIYQLLQDAGGPLSNANLVTLNLAAKLNDGQEIYVTAIGESLPSDITSPASPSSASSALNQQLVNLNVASADELRQQLSISSKTAQSIITYRQQHGPFTSAAQLLQVVSKAIYDKIKNKITV